MTYFERDIGRVISKALDEMPVVVLTGMRQSGKTTFLQNNKAFRQREYITFDDFAHLEAAKANPEAVIGMEGPITIDEAQNVLKFLMSSKETWTKRGSRAGFCFQALQILPF